ncbi:MAG: RsiV family protein [Lachnospiraceae bacterium]
MKRGKEVYDKIEIPAELSERVNEAIASVDSKQARKKAKVYSRNRKLVTFIRTTGTLAAALVICLTVGVNSSQVLAVELGSLPVIGPLARVLTVRSFEEHEESVDLVAEVPQIEEAVTAQNTSEGGSLTAAGGMGEETTDTYVADINAEINAIVDDFVAKAKQDMADYKDAFFATGGTEEEWADRSMDVQVSYEVKYQSGPYLSLVLHANECWVAAYQENNYYNLDLENHRDITLEDLLGPDYITICNESIINQIEEQISEDENKIYFGYGPTADELDEEWKFTTITPETHFYINENGNPVICFEKYEIAPGYMGVCEFEILRKN